MKINLFTIRILLRYYPYFIFGTLFITLSSFSGGCRTLGSGDEEYYAVQMTNDNKLIMAGYTTSNYMTRSGGAQYLNNKGESDFFLSKRDTFDNAFSFDINDIIWDKSYGGSGTDKALGLAKTTDGGYIMAGFTESNDGNVIGNHGGRDVWVVKTNNEGVLQWSKCYGGSRSETAYAIRQTSDGGYIFVGNTNSTNGDVANIHSDGSDYPASDVWVVKIDAFGNIQWQKCLGGSGSDGGYDIQTMPNGRFILAGFTSSKDGDIGNNHTTSQGSATTDAWIAVLDVAGNRLWSNCYGGEGNDVAMSIKPITTTTGAVSCVFVGYTSSSNSGDVDINRGSFSYDVFCMRLNQNGTGFNTGWRKTYGGSGNDYGKDIILASGTLILLANSTSTDGDVPGGAGPTTLRLSFNNGGIISFYKPGDYYHSRGNQLIQYKPDGIIGIGGGEVTNGKELESPYYDPNLEAGIGKTDITTFLSAFQDEDEANAKAFSKKEDTRKGLVDMQVFPNPTTEKVTVSFNQEQTSDVTIQLFDVSGKMIHSLILPQVAAGKYQQEIPLNRLNKGVYVVKFLSGKQMSSQKLIVN